MRSLLLVVALSVAACAGTAELRDFDCAATDAGPPVADGGTNLCLPCADNSECVIAGNPCSDWMVCMQKDTQVAFTMQGCSPEPAVPAADRCRCEQGHCHAEP